MIFVVAHHYYGKGERLEEALTNAARSGATAAELRDYRAYYVDPLEIKHIWLHPARAKQATAPGVEWEWSSSADRRKPPVLISQGGHTSGWFDPGAFAGGTGAPNG